MEEERNLEKSILEFTTASFLLDFFSKDISLKNHLGLIFLSPENSQEIRDAYYPIPGAWGFAPGPKCFKITRLS